MPAFFVKCPGFLCGFCIIGFYLFFDRTHPSFFGIRIDGCFPSPYDIITTTLHGQHCQDQPYHARRNAAGMPRASDTAIKMDLLASWASQEELPTDVYENVTAAKCAAVAYARRNKFALRVKRQDKYLVCMECVKGESINQIIKLHQ